MDLSLEEYLAVPYMLIMESFEGPDGDWRRRASYPELPGCTVVGLWAVDVIEELDQLRVRLIEGMVRDRQEIPVPRPPLQSRPPVLDPARMGFARWLVEHGKLSET